MSKPTQTAVFSLGEDVGSITAKLPASFYLDNLSISYINDEGAKITIVKEFPGLEEVEND